MTAFVPQQPEPSEDDLRKTVADLAARVVMLESAMALFIGLPPPQSQSPERVEAPLPVIDTNARSLGHTQILRHLGSIKPEVGGEPDLPQLPAQTSSNLTEFAGLDDALAEAAEAERVVPLPRSTSSTFQEIDPEHVERQMAKPPPERLEVHSALEIQYPKILAKILAMWPEPELVPYLNKLIVDDRGSRNGFDQEVMSELLIISQLLADPKLGRGGMWGIRSR